MDYCDPVGLAKSLRPKIIKDGKYLVARIAGAGQDPGEQKVLDDYFRYKDYIHNREWFQVLPKDRWSPRFLGFADNWKDGRLESLRKVEFQNPPYAAAYRLGGDPKNYSKVFTVQIAGCDFDCNYCFVPRRLNVGDAAFGRYFSAAEIVDAYLSVKSRSDAPMNVIRLSGGNPTIVPEAILGVYREMSGRGLSDYLWIDTNLSTHLYMQALGREFSDMLARKNVGIVGCFKGTDEKDFSIISGVAPDFFQLQFETARWLLEQRADLYIYLPALVYGDVEKSLAGFVRRLATVHKNLALRTELLAIIDFPGAWRNYARAALQARPMPTTDQKAVFDAWYNKLLPGLYSPKELEKFSCQAKLYE